MGKFAQSLNINQAALLMIEIGAQGGNNALVAARKAIKNRYGLEFPGNTGQNTGPQR